MTQRCSESGALEDDRAKTIFDSCMSKYALITLKDDDRRARILPILQRVLDTNCEDFGDNLTNNLPIKSPTDTMMEAYSDYMVHKTQFDTRFKIMLRIMETAVAFDARIDKSSLERFIHNLGVVEDALDRLVILRSEVRRCEDNIENLLTHGSRAGIEPINSARFV